MLICVVVVHNSQIMLRVNSVWRWDGDVSAGSLCGTETKALSCFERDFPCQKKPCRTPVQPWVIKEPSKVKANRCRKRGGGDKREVQTGAATQSVACRLDLGGILGEAGQDGAALSRAGLSEPVPGERGAGSGAGSPRGTRAKEEGRKEGSGSRRMESEK